MSMITYNRKSTHEKPLPFRFCTVCDAHEQEDRARPDGIECHQILLVVEGEGEMQIAGDERIYHLHRGCAFFTAYGVPVSYRNTGGLVSAFLTVEGEASDRLVESYGKKFFFYENVNTDQYLAAIRRLTDGFYGGRTEGALSALAYTFYTDFFEEGKGKRSALDELRLYVERHFAKKLTLAELAKVYHASQSKMSHDFKAAYGLSPMQYVLSCRLDYARRLLTDEPQLSAKTVALFAGFKDASYFARAYRSAFGCAPKTSQMRE